MEDNNPIKLNDRKEKEKKIDPEEEEVKKIKEDLNRINPKLASKEEMEDISNRMGKILNKEYGKKVEPPSKKESALTLGVIAFAIVCLVALIISRLV